jgi:hypothetical protein
MVRHEGRGSCRCRSSARHASRPPHAAMRFALHVHGTRHHVHGLQGAAQNFIGSAWTAIRVRAGSCPTRAEQWPCRNEVVERCGKRRPAVVFRGHVHSFLAKKGPGGCDPAGEFRRGDAKPRRGGSSFVALGEKFLRRLSHRGFDLVGGHGWRRDRPAGGSSAASAALRVACKLLQLFRRSNLPPDRVLPCTSRGTRRCRVRPRRARLSGSRGVIMHWRQSLAGFHGQRLDGVGNLRVRARG